MIATLRNRNFDLLWLATLISRAGDWVLLVGLPIYVYLLTHSVLAISVTLVAAFLPQIALGSVAGVLVDRWDRKQIMVASNLLLAIALLPLLLVRTPDRVWIIYVVSFVETSLEQFFTPAENALLPALVGEEHLVPANSLNSLVQNLSRLLGPALGGLVAVTFGLLGIVAADALSFVLAAGLIAAISGVATAALPKTPLTPLEPVTEADSPAGSRKGIWSEWTGGLRVIGSEPVLWVLLCVFSVSSLGEGCFATLYPVFVYQVLHGNALQIGELMSAQAIGGLVGGLLLGWIGNRVLSAWVMGPCLMLFGLIDLAIFNTPAFFPFYWLSFGLFIAVGIPGIISLTGAESRLQASAPDAYRGRVFGILGTAMGLFMLVGTLVAGVVTHHLGVVTVLNIQGTSYVVAGLFLIWGLPKGSAATKTVTADPADPVAGMIAPESDIVRL
jgi:MFS family permease